MEMTLAAFELDRKDDRSRDKHCVDSASESRDRKFQEDRAGKSKQSAAENPNLFFPCLTLVDVEVMSVRRR